MRVLLLPHEVRKRGVSYPSGVVLKLPENLVYTRLVLE